MSIRLRLLLSFAHEYVQQPAGLSESTGSCQTATQLKPESAIDRLRERDRKAYSSLMAATFKLRHYLERRKFHRSWPLKPRWNETAGSCS